MRSVIGVLSLGLCLVVLSGCGGDDSEAIDFNGVWDVTVRLGANSCANDVPILDVLNYVHSVSANSDRSAFNAVIVRDNNDDVFQSVDATVTEDSFIATGSTHELSPFINDMRCEETVIWSYFEISESGDTVFTNNVGRNSLINCTGPSGTANCAVYYSGAALKRES